MPHLRLEYSAPLTREADIGALCDALRLAMIGTGLFPTAGIRVRAFAADAYAMTDGNRDDRFLAMVLTVGQGRSQDALHAAGADIFKAAEVFLAPLIANKHLSLSLDIAESVSALSFKNNPIHKRIAAGRP